MGLSTVSSGISYISSGPVDLYLQLLVQAFLRTVFYILISSPVLWVDLYLQLLVQAFLRTVFYILISSPVLWVDLYLQLREYSTGCFDFPIFPVNRVPSLIILSLPLSPSHRPHRPKANKYTMIRYLLIHVSDHL